MTSVASGRSKRGSLAIISSTMDGLEIRAFEFAARRKPPVAVVIRYFDNSDARSDDTWTASRERARAYVILARAIRRFQRGSSFCRGEQHTVDRTQPAGGQSRRITVLRDCREIEGMRGACVNTREKSGGQIISQRTSYTYDAASSQTLPISEPLCLMQ